MSCAARAADHSLRRVTGVLAAAIAVIVAIEFIAVGLLPVLARSMKLSLTEAGAFVTVFAVAAGLLGPPLTMLTERLEPRRTLVLVLVVFGVGNLMAALFADPVIVIAARVAQGAALPVFVSVANAEVAAMARTERPGLAIARLNNGLIIGLIVALPAGVALADGSDWRSPFAVLGALSLLMALLVGAMVPAGRSYESHSLLAQAGLLGDRLFLTHLLLSGSIFAAMFTAYAYLAAFLDNVAGFDPIRVALALAGFGAVGLLGNHWAGRMVDRGPVVVTMVAILALGLAMTALSLVGSSLALLMPVFALWGLAHGACFALCQVRVMLAGRRAPAFASSLNIAACNLGIAIGAAFGGVIVANLGLEAIGFGGAALALFALVIAALTRWLERAEVEPAR